VSGGSHKSGAQVPLTDDDRSGGAAGDRVTSYGWRSSSHMTAEECERAKTKPPFGFGAAPKKSKKKRK
jgi:hypothetical protein